MTTEALGTATTDAAPAPAAPWVPDDSAFGARLALIRQRMGWGNVKEGALACRIPVQSWRTWERDNVYPRNYPAICRQISVITGCDLDWLMRGSQPVEGSEHKIAFAQRVIRPINNRPPGGPRKGDERPEVRRPRRITPPPAGTTTRRAA